jgi:TolB-like protein
MRITVMTLVVVFLSAGIPTPVMAQVACIVTGVSGHAVLVREQAPDVNVTKFRKFVVGDRIELGQSAKLRLTYLDQDTAEDWMGPARLLVAAQGAMDETGAATPVRASLGIGSLGVTDSELLRDQRELVSGQFRVRGVENDAALDYSGEQGLKALREKCDALRAMSPEGDGTADIVYLAGLEKLGQKAEMARHLRGLAGKNPGIAQEGRPRLAVLDFETLGDPSRYKDLGRAVSEMLTSALGKTGAFDLVERKHLESLLGEMEIGPTPNSGLVAEKIGNLAQADASLCGTVTALQGGIRIDARIISVSDGRIVAARDAKASGSAGSLEAAVASLAARFAADGPAGLRRANAVAAGPTSLFQFGVTARRGGQEALIPISDGASLRSGDQYKIFFTPDRDAHVYVFQADSAGQLYMLHPSREFLGTRMDNANPVQKGREYVLPAPDKAYVLDDQVGRERIYLVVRDMPDASLDTLCQSLASAETRQDAVASASAQKEILNNFQTRGIALLAKDAKGDAGADSGSNAFTLLGQRINAMCSDCAQIMEFSHLP